jgi:hypothetical protein
VPEADIEVICMQHGCSTLVSAIEIIRDFQSAYGNDEARPPAHGGTAVSKKAPWGDLNRFL